MAGVWRAALTVDANESLEDFASGLIVTGLDKGDGLPIRFAASEEDPRGGIFTSLGTSFLFVVWSKSALFEADEDGAGFEVAIAAGSRLLP